MNKVFIKTPHTSELSYVENKFLIIIYKNLCPLGLLYISNTLRRVLRSEEDL